MTDKSLLRDYTRQRIFILTSSILLCVFILNGGMNAWTKDASRPVNATPATPQPSKIAVTFSNKWLATRNNVLAVVKGEDDARLIDARPEAFYRGKKQGKGILRYPSRSEYEGEWKNDMVHGMGEFRYANGHVYVG